MTTCPDLRNILRTALSNLYSPSALRRSDLLSLKGLPPGATGASELREFLVREIRALEPSPGTPPDSELRRSYEILLYRYVQQCSQLEVARQIGVSERHLRRLESRALDMLGERLSHSEAGGKIEPGHLAAPSEMPSPAFPTFDEELDRLPSSVSQVTDLSMVMCEIEGLLHPLATSAGIAMEYSIPAHAIQLCCQQMLVREILLGIGSLAIRNSDGGTISLAASRISNEAAIEVRSSNPGNSLIGAPGAPTVAMVRRLVSRCGGTVLYSPDKAISFRVSLPVAQQIPILLVDDNPDILDLLRRYADGTRYTVTAAATMDDIATCARASSPHVILLDVMMPDVDGWELLGRLRMHPLTHHIPVIVLTVLAQEDLALSLGASAFLQKPITRETLLRALDQQTGLGAPAPL